MFLFLFIFCFLFCPATKYIPKMSYFALKSSKFVSAVGGEQTPIASSYKLPHGSRSILEFLEAIYKIINQKISHKAFKI